MPKSVVDHWWPSLVGSRTNPVNAAEIYPWIQRAMPELEKAFGQPKRLLGGGMFGQAFDMGYETVVKVTMSSGEASAAEHIIQVRRESPLEGFVYLEAPVLLGEFHNHLISTTKPSPLWAIPKVLVHPLPIGEVRAVNRASWIARHPAAARFQGFETLQESVVRGEIERGSLGTPFEFASETAQDWVEAKTSAQKKKLLREYDHWVGVIQDVPGFESVGVSMEEYTDRTGVPMHDVRPENCGLTADDRIVCFDLMEPEPRRMINRRESLRPKARR